MEEPSIQRVIKSFLYAVSPLFILITVYWIRNLLSYVLKRQMPAFDKWSEYWGDIPLHFTLTWAVLFFSWALFQRYQQQKKEIANQALNAERFAKEKEIERSQFIEQQKNELEKTVDERTAELKQSLHELKSTQAQLIQSEKMASLGELTAGIAHEIQNPLNFVNNFSEVNDELIEELRSESQK
jgi:C4-dicarboxylate-specific signal transduction histidine kinase